MECLTLLVAHRQGVLTVPPLYAGYLPIAAYITYHGLLHREFIINVALYRQVKRKQGILFFLLALTMLEGQSHMLEFTVATGLWYIVEIRSNIPPLTQHIGRATFMALEEYHEFPVE